ncbi:hypothetical protein KKF91_13790 [Myxococcota bacterium]|nr:hypothetical protein [Myxococcota bacterium]MBU1431610.1 hypothetical protein [Myxococcota bacterium]MBU1900055.1 hypothetical protein [Myxococcota bacterium]
MHRAIFIVCLALLPFTAFAQDVERDLEAELMLESSLIEGAELEARPNMDKVKLVDPDEKLLDEVENARKAIEERFNNLQIKAAQFAETQEQMGKLMYDMVGAHNKHFGKKDERLKRYQIAIEKRNDKAKAQAAAEIIKSRKEYLKGVAGFQTRANKIEKRIEELAKIVEAEEEEDEE